MAASGVRVTPDPFRVVERTAISVSGGRTSAYMLWRVLQAHGGSLPPDTVAMFANTGKEQEATLVFVRECAARWEVPIVWVEYRDDEAGFAVVDFDSASRAGEPFEAIIRKRRYLPNPVTRFCTSELKIRVMHKHLATLGWKQGDDGWDQMIGIRADEQRRVAKIRTRGHSSESAKETMRMPLADAGVRVGDVRDFWLAQPFALDLATDARGRTTGGNCDLCFLKPPAAVLSLIREKPERATWWARMESQVPVLTAGDRGPGPTGDGWRFRKDWPGYAAMARFVAEQRELFSDGHADDEAIECYCGE